MSEIKELLGKESLVAIKDYIDIKDSGKEAKENKTTILSDASTDEQYPSAKAVVDYVDNKTPIATQSIVNLTWDNIAEVKEVITQNPGALIKFDEYIYAPTYQSETIPSYYSSFASDEEYVRYLIINWEEEEENIQCSAYRVPKDQIISTDYWDLKYLRDNAQLIPGQQYRIIDYVTTTTQEDTQSAGHQFDIIVTADDERTLNENTRAVIHEGDTYFQERAEKVISAKFKDGITVDDVQVLYELREEKELAYGTGETNTIVLDLTTFINEDGVEVPAFRDVDPDSDVYYINTFLPIEAVLSDEDELLYDSLEEWNNHEDVLIELGYEPDGQPILYKHDPMHSECRGLDNIDEGEFFLYEGDFVWEGETYNLWVKYEPDSEDHLTVQPFKILTRVVVVDNKFTITQEELRNGIQLNTDVENLGNPATYYYVGTYEVDGEIFDCWKEEAAEDDSSFWRLTNRVVDAELELGERTLKAQLNAWEIKYYLDNDTSKYSWADEENGKGVIYFMKDEWGNEAPYDFKNIQFIRRLTTGELDKDSGTPTYCYTFGGLVDRSIYQEGLNIYRSNIIKDYPQGVNCGNAFLLPNNVFLGTSQCMTKNNVLGHGCTDNTFGDNCQNNIFGNDCSLNTFSMGCCSNIFGNNCVSNTFGSSCYENIFHKDCSSNTFGNGCYSNTLGDNCCLNKFDYNCYSNHFDERCYDNTFGSDCHFNVFEIECYSNTFGNQCNSNTFGHECYSNNFSNDCSSNKFGDNCSFNTFNTSCKNNTFGNYCSDNEFNYGCDSNKFDDNCGSNIFDYYCDYNTFGNYFRINTFGNNCKYNSFGDACSSNRFSNLCSNNTFGNNCDNNHFDSECCDNIFSNHCSSNSFSIECNSNKFGDECNNNNFGDSCGNNSLGNRCKNNTFAVNCWSNTLGSDCYKNSFGDSEFSDGESCSSNTLDRHCSFNSFGYECYNNLLGEQCERNTLACNCTSNTFGKYCRYNTFASTCYHNTFANDCSFNSFGEECTNNIFANNCQNNTFAESYVSYNEFKTGVSYINLTSTSPDSASYSNLLQNIIINPGVKGKDRNNKRTIIIERGLPYSTTISAPGSREIILDEEE